MSSLGAKLFRLMPAHLIVLAAVQWFAFWGFFHFPVAVTGVLILMGLLALSTRTAGWILWGPFLRRGQNAGVALALSTDSSELHALVRTLHEIDIPCSVFLTAEQTRDTTSVRRILDAGCEIGVRLNPCPLWNTQKVRQQLRLALDSLKASNLHPKLFLAPNSRSGPALWPVLVEFGLVGLRCDRLPSDGANRTPFRDGTLFALHIPTSTTPHLKGLLESTASHAARSTRGILAMSSVLGLSSVSSDPVQGDRSVPRFYDTIAASYDREQDARKQNHLRNVEQGLVDDHLLAGFGGDERVLELGAGTGRFTLAIARRVKRIVAVDISAEMLSVLERKAAEAGLDSLETLHSDIETCWSDATFDTICAMSSLEYVTDFSGVMAHAAESLNEGGVLYFTTAHRTPFRWFTQIGNAMRQGIWLHARTGGEVRRVLEGLGFQDIQTSTHGLRLPFVGGMLLEVRARKAG